MIQITGVHDIFTPAVKLSVLKETPTKSRARLAIYPLCDGASGSGSVVSAHNLSWIQPWMLPILRFNIIL